MTASVRPLNAQERIVLEELAREFFGAVAVDEDVEEEVEMLVSTDGQWYKSRPDSTWLPTSSNPFYEASFWQPPIPKPGPGCWEWINGGWKRCDAEGERMMRQLVGEEARMLHAESES